MVWALIGVTAMAELIKPKLGELGAAALDAKDAASALVILGAALVCVVIGAAGGVVALHVAEAPARSYAVAMDAVVRARQATAAAQTLVDAVPTCTPDMPTSRCDRMRENNAETLANRQARLQTASVDEEDAKRRLSATPAPGPGLPRIGLAQKALFVGGAEFLIMGVPFAALRLNRRRRNVVAQPTAQECATPPSSDSPADRTPVGRVNDGGWAERREKYGPTGRRTRHVEAVGRA